MPERAITQMEAPPVEAAAPPQPSTRRRQVDTPQGTVLILTFFAATLVALWVYAYVQLVTRG